MVGVGIGQVGLDGVVGWGWWVVSKGGRVLSLQCLVEVGVSSVVLGLWWMDLH